jgi:hypothetical protein
VNTERDYVNDLEVLKDVCIFRFFFSFITGNLLFLLLEIYGGFKKQ